MKNLNQILLDLECIEYSYNKAKNLIQKDDDSGSSTCGISELVNIISELEVNNIKYQVDGDLNIQL